MSTNSVYMATSSAVDTYIATFPDDIQALLNEVRQTIRTACPDALESIAYGMPAYKTFGKPLVYFGGFKKHLGFYATPSGHAEFHNELSQYKQGKGSVQFQYNEPIPYDLIARIVQFRAWENAEKAHK